jgi:hypothetical protein
VNKAIEAAVFEAVKANIKVNHASYQEQEAQRAIDNGARYEYWKEASDALKVAQEELDKANTLLIKAVARDAEGW